jgi:hypothetical protein
MKTKVYSNNIFSKKGEISNLGDAKYTTLHLLQIKTLKK